MSTTYTYNVTGMTCGSCVAYLESNISKLSDVESVSVSLMLNKAEIKSKDGRQDEFLNAIKTCGFVPTFISATNSNDPNQSQQRKPLGLKKPNQQQKAPMLLAPPDDDDDDNDDNNNDQNQSTNIQPADVITTANDDDAFDEFESALDDVNNNDIDPQQRSTQIETSTPNQSNLSVSIPSNDSTQLRNVPSSPVRHSDDEVKDLIDEFDALLTTVQSPARKPTTPHHSTSTPAISPTNQSQPQLQQQEDDTDQQPIEQPQEKPKGSCCGGKEKVEEQPKEDIQPTIDTNNEENEFKFEFDPIDDDFQSYNPDFDQKVDINDQINSTATDKTKPSNQQHNEDSTIDITPHVFTLDNSQSFSSDFPSQNQYSTISTSVIDPIDTSDFDSTAQSSIQSNEIQPTTTPPKGSCCGGKKKQPQQEPIESSTELQQPQEQQQQQEPVLTTTATTPNNSTETKPKGSCCGGKSKPQEPTALPGSQPTTTTTPTMNEDTNNDFLGLDFTTKSSPNNQSPMLDDFLNVLASNSPDSFEQPIITTELTQNQHNNKQDEKPKGSCCGGKKKDITNDSNNNSIDEPTTPTPTVLTPSQSQVQSILSEIDSQFEQTTLSMNNSTGSFVGNDDYRPDLDLNQSGDDFQFEFNDPQAKLDRVAEFDPLQQSSQQQQSQSISNSIESIDTNPQPVKKGSCCGQNKSQDNKKQVISTTSSLPSQEQQQPLDSISIDISPTPSTPITPSQPSSPSTSNEVAPTHTFNVTGMTCGSCVAYLESKIKLVEGVESVSVSLMLNKAEIKGSNKDVLFDAIKAAGFTPTYISTSKGKISRSQQMNQNGLKMPSQRLAEGIASTPNFTPALSPVVPMSEQDPNNVHSVDNFSNSSQSNNNSNSSQPERDTTTTTTTTTTTNTTSPNSISSKKMKKPKLETPSEKLAKQAYAWLIRLQIALCFAIPIFIIAMILPWNETANRILMTPLVNSASTMGIVLFLLATPVQFGVGRIFITNSIQALKNGHANMSVLIAIGSLSAYLYSLVALGINFFTFDDSPYSHGGMREHFFETSSTLITVVIFGQYLEHVAKGHTSTALSKLMQLQPSNATYVEIVPNSIEKSQNLNLRTNQQDDDLFATIQTYIPSFSYHYNTSSFSLDVTNHGSKDPSGSTIVIGGTTTFLTAPQKYKFQHLLQENGLLTEMLDDTHDINKHIVQNSTQIIDTDDLETGQYVKIIRGSKIPADCMVAFGTCYVDDSVVTGESIQRKKIPGSTLIGGTIVTEGVCIAMILRAGEDTTLSQIVTLVEQAQISKAPISAFADQISLYFVPTIIALSIFTLFMWYMLGTWFNVLYTQINPITQKPETLSVFTHAVLRAVAVVVIACPCALGLATPTAVMVATGVGAKYGVLIKGGAALEAAANVNTVVFDKTGTITRGKPQVVCSMMFSPNLLNTYLGDEKGTFNGNNTTGGSNLSTKTGNNQYLLKLLQQYLPTHLLFIQDDVQLSHYSGIVKSSIDQFNQQSQSNNQFGQIDVHSSSNLSQLQSTIYPQGLSQGTFSFQLHQILRVLFTLVNLAESNSEHFIGTCLAKYMKEQVLTLGENLVQNKEQFMSQYKTSQKQYDMLLELNESYFSMSHVVNQTGRGVKCDIAIPLSFLPKPTIPNDIDSKSNSNINGITLANVIIGNANWLIENNIYIPPIIASIAIQLESQGLTVIFTSIQGYVVNLFSIGDEIKPEAYEVIDYLQRVLQYQIFVLTGDNIRNAKFLASRLKIPSQQVYAHLSPQQKLNIIQQLQIHGKVLSPNNHMPISNQTQRLQQEQLKESQRFKIHDVLQYIPIIGWLIRFMNNSHNNIDSRYGINNNNANDNENRFNTTSGGNGNNSPSSTSTIPSVGRSIVYIGDGINDSPALAQAQVGIAIGAGTDVAIESADMVLVRNDLTDLLTALVLSKATLHRIKSNFGWSLLYNVLSIPLAAGLLFPITNMILPPEVAALAMGCSSVSVVLSSLWLKLFQPPLQQPANKQDGDDKNNINEDNNNDGLSVGFDRKPNKNGYMKQSNPTDNNNNSGDHHSIMVGTANLNKSISSTVSKQQGKYSKFNDQE